MVEELFPVEDFNFTERLLGTYENESILLKRDATGFFITYGDSLMLV